MPPSLGRVMEGSTLEDVLFMRDEMANLAWAIERCTESPIEQSLPRVPASEIDAPPGTDTAHDPGAAYAALPPFVASAGELDSAAAGAACGWTGQGHLPLRRGAVLQPDGSMKVHRAQGDVLSGS
jgi:hypothetical protein